MAESIEARVLLAKQAILDAHQKTYGFELLFRGDFVDGDAATSQVLLNAFAELDIDEVVGGGRAFVNFTRGLLMAPPPFDPRRLVIEVLEDIEPDATLLDRLADLRAQGYEIALDDFILHPGHEVLLPHAHFVKIDVLALDDAELERHARELSTAGLRLLAEKVEDRQMFRRCEALGFTLFQGYFFAMPELVTGRSLDASRIAVLRLLAQLNDHAADFDSLRDVISSDAGLSYKLLRFMNSATFALRTPVTSIPNAMSLLGMDQIRQWATLLAMTTMADKPHALSLLAAARAATCEQLCQGLGAELDAQSGFTVGLLSTMDAFFDQPLETLVEALPLTGAIKAALVQGSGPLGAVLTVALRRERGETCDEVGEALGLRDELIDAAYWRGQQFADQLVHV